MVEHKDWKWFGSAAHFICGRWCRFHLATQVGKYLISTVGEYVHPRHSNGNEHDEAVWLKENYPGEDIGCGRKYETMVFIAGAVCEAAECGCGLPSIDGMEIQILPANTAGEATRNHYELCEKYSHDNPERSEG